jgi:heme o synthase
MMQNFAKSEILTDKNELVKKIFLISELTKFKITVLVSLTTALGYILAANEINLTLLYSVLGIFLLACSSSALNQYQEIEIDRSMSRTLNRPLPSGRVSENFVFNLSIIFLISGSLVLLIFTNIPALLIGVFTFFWYNGVYTPLKRKSALAIIPGSLVGALPPLAGWAAAGGSLLDFNIYLISFYFFIWQIPHFWLLLLIYGKEYSSAGLPVLNNIFTEKQIKKITFVWIIISMLISVAIAFSGIVIYSFSLILLLIASGFLLFNSLVFLYSDAGKKDIVKMFVKINVHTLLIIVLLSSDKLINIFKNI